ncbi:putative N-acetylmannosamine-6-phosphate 2-epimerase [Ensifer soli]|uniref:putative N-acetylmannosamine-6-phosphate 2-epimerase n=1 Tax=Ciceribacter sp. sgz301302 TaxID=3342379 RepID=UPI0035B8EF61
MAPDGTTPLDRDLLRHGLIVSCQPVPDGPTDTAEFVVGFARAAVAAGACAVRIESVRYVAAVRAAVAVPVIGIVKRDLDDSPVRITPFVADVEALADAGADIIAIDATDRVRPATVGDLVAAIRRRGRLAMADCATLADAERALALGVAYVGTTLSGYTDGPVPEDPDLALVQAMRALTPHVIAEGRLKVPQDARDAAEAGAFAVVVGSAITRTEHATGWFLDAARQGWRADNAAPSLAIDLGGTKTLVALVRGAAVLSSQVIATDRAARPETWLKAARDLYHGWGAPEIGGVGLAVTGVVRDGAWSALNPGTLPVPEGFPLVDSARGLFPGLPVTALNDAQAAAWGEHRHGAGRGARDLVFLTVSTGIGGGIVLDGRLRRGLSGHFGQTGGPECRFEDGASGRFIADSAARAGHPADAKAVFTAAGAGAAWAAAILDDSAARIAGLCRNIRLTLDVGRIVIGGGIGLAPGFLERVSERLALLPGHLRPDVLPAALGAEAGIVGVADLAARA